MAVDAKDQITHGHIRRVQTYAVELAKRLGVNDTSQIKAIEAAALLHDMGKLAIPEHILNKPGKLTPAEFDKMKRHADIGADLLSSVKFPYPVVPIVRHHHENWDGTGYPSGIAGTDIPIGARILSVVDCFDALTSDRPYRPRLSDEDAFRMLRERRGSIHDPLIVDVFIAAHHEIAAAVTASSIEPASDTVSSVSDPDASRSFRNIRANAAETALLLACRGRILTASTDEEALAAAAQCLRQATPAVVYALFAYDTNNDSLVCRYATGHQSHLLSGLRIPMGERVTGWSGATRRPSVNSDAALDLTRLAEFFEPPLRGVLSTPLSRNDRLLGVLTAYSNTRDAFRDHDCYVFEQIGDALVDRLCRTSAIDQARTLTFRPRTQ
jgi:putative nucleotidyltransferase with HDIG domain